MGQAVSTEGTEPYQVTFPGNGTLTGYTFTNPATGNKSCVRFAKVPYAQPPTGEYRFKRPRELPEDFDYTGDYKELGLKCPQASVPNADFHYVKSPSDENITYLNIWKPYSDKYKPEGGWPVFFYIHGGWLQFGDPNRASMTTLELFDDDEFSQKYILVTCGYRLNMFGFLSGKELLEEDPTSANFGFWDQRLAIEWTYKNIKYFGGNPEKFTLGGLSAGSYSTFFQMCYELYHPEEKQIIKQLVFFSNMPWAQPKTIAESQDQFDEVIEKLGIPKSATGAEKLKKLRSLSADFIEDFIYKLKLHTFRAVTDGHFISPNIIPDIASGKMAKLMKQKGVRLICGEVNNECLKYSELDTPQTIEQLPIEVENYYPRKITEKLLEVYNADQLKEDDPDLKQKLQDKYGAIIGDGQVYAAERGFLQKLAANGFPTEDIYRYRVSYRADWLKDHLPVEHKVPHSADNTIWFYTLREGYTDKEKELLQVWLKPYLQFLNFEDDVDGWSNDEITKLRHFAIDGTDEYIEDTDWDWGTKVADAVYGVQT